MQATTTMKRFVFNRAGSMAVALIIVTGSVIGITALAIGDETSQERAVESARVMPNAYTSLGQGEGLIDAANTRIAAVAPLQAFTSVGQGEGLVDGTNRSIAQAPIQAYPGIGQGEGLVGPGGSINPSDTSPGQSQSVTSEVDNHAIIIRDTGGPWVSPSDAPPVETVNVTAYPPGAFDY